MLLPGGIEQYLAERPSANEAAANRPADRNETASARERKAGKQLSRIESQLRKLDEQISKLHGTMAEAAADHLRLGELNGELRDLHARQEALEEEWLALADD